MSTPLCHVIRSRLAQHRRYQPGGALLMAHLVLGYPSLEENRRVIAQMVANGVDLIELQIPFSEPIADGPVIARANHIALQRGFRVRDGLALIAEMTALHQTPMLVMTYANILEAYGASAFIDDTARIGARGLIVPDYPMEESNQLRKQSQRLGLSWVALLTPTTADDRLRELGTQAQGFCYCVARKGVTGKQTDFGRDLDTFIARCRRSTDLPLAVGFGVKRAEDVRRLEGVADIVVVGTAAIEVQERSGTPAVGQFFAELKASRNAERQGNE
jgi:tryptophan synthase alpha chain